MDSIFYNPYVLPIIALTPPGEAPLHFHRRVPGYEPTPLIRVPALANRLGVGEVFVKDESNRFGLPAFKILGASWAVYRALVERLGKDIEHWPTIEALKHRLALLRPLRLIAATDGNHGRGVARIASLLGIQARIFVPQGTAVARIAAIESEGAEVIKVDGTYDETVARAASEQSEDALLVQDTAWAGYEKIPRWVIEGYETMFCEIDEKLSEMGYSRPDCVLVQIGVGALAAAVVIHYRHQRRANPSCIIGVEPVKVPRTIAALKAQSIVTVPGPHTSIMAGLNCGRLSSVAWPILRDGLAAVVTVNDGRAKEAMRKLATAGIISGESGAAGMAGLMELLSNPDAEYAREKLGLKKTASVLLISTEGATDPETYRSIVGDVFPR